MTRILFLTESYHPVLGGAERHLRALARALASWGLPTTVLTRRSDPGWPAVETLDGVRVVRVGPAGPARRGKYLMLPGVGRALVRERRGYGIVVVRGTRVLGLPGLVAGRWLGKRVVLQCEVTGEMSGEIYTWGTRWDGAVVRAAVRGAVFLRNRALADADAFVAISERTRSEFLAAGLDPDRIHLIPHGVDTERFRPATPDERTTLRRSLGLPDGRIVVFAGRLLRGKGVHVLLEAFARIGGQERNARLVLVGSGAGQALSAEDELREAARAAGLEGRVTFTGRVDNVEDYLRASDVFGFPSFFEAMPLAVLEAAACGLPCVASSVGGIPDVIEDGVSGLLVPAGEVAALASALGRVMGDPDLAARLGASARQRVLERFALGRNLERYRTLFLELGAGA